MKFLLGLLIVGMLNAEDITYGGEITSFCSISATVGTVAQVSNTKELSSAAAGGTPVIVTVVTTGVNFRLYVSNPIVSITNSNGSATLTMTPNDESSFTVTETSLGVSSEPMTVGGILIPSAGSYSFTVNYDGVSSQELEAGVYTVTGTVVCSGS